MTKHRIRDNQSIRVINDHNEVHAIDSELRNRYGELYNAVSRDHIYKEIQKITGYCTKQIAFILNHTRAKIGDN